MPNTESQREQILAWLRERPISPIEALEQFGCFRLGARIHELRQAGHDIHTEQEPHPGGRHARYFLIREAA